MVMQTIMQEVIEQSVTDGRGFNRTGGNLAWIVPHYMQSCLKGVDVCLMNYEFKDGNILPEVDLRDDSYIVFDENMGLIVETVLGKPQPCLSRKLRVG